MTPEEHNLISGLFDRLSQASGQAKDAEADQLIRSKVAEVPTAPYMLVQSILVMQQALTNAQNRIAALEKQLAETNPVPGTQQGGGSFLAGVASLFGGGQPHPQPPRATPPPPPAPQPQAPTQPAQPQAYGNPPPLPQSAGRGGAGGFLQGALSTAAGVAGGALLFQGIESLLGHNPGPFSGAYTSSGGFLGGDRPVENTEITNNYYTEGDENRGQSDQGSAEQTAYADPDPDPDPGTTDDYASDTTDFGDDDGGGGGDDSSYV